MWIPASIGWDVTPVGVWLEGFPNQWDGDVAGLGVGFIFLVETTSSLPNHPRNVGLSSGDWRAGEGDA